MSIRLLFLSACLLFIPIQAEAHKIHVFAWVAGDTVTVESSFSGNKPLLHGKIIVKDNTSGAVLLQGIGNTKGIFTFIVPPEARAKKADLLIVVTGSDGHQSEWLVPATEYLLEDSSQVAEQHADTISNAELQLMIKKIVEQELAPIKRRLAENRQDKPDLRDIMAGIGFLLGIAGLVIWMRNRKAKGAATDD
jgi:nickel transport protein